ncbi:MAG: Fe-S protein assembly co-chaperone HscB [Planctomycetota bacterium]
MKKPNPFAIFGLTPRLDLDEAQLERTYLQLSKDCHPDRVRGASRADCVAVLQRAASINDAFAVLRDRWARARAFLELAEPGVLDRTKALDPAFLMDALEQAEQVANAEDSALPDLKERIAKAVDASFQSVVDAVRAGDVEAAAVRFHEAHYHRKALADLDARLEPELSR